MADIRLIVTDLDGTFLATHNDAHPENARALRHARQNGITVCACTGRSWTMCRHVVKRYGFDPYTITSGGAAIIDADTEQALYAKTMAPTALLPLLYASWRTGIETIEVFAADVCAAFGQGVEDKFLRARVRNAVMPEGEREHYRPYDDFLEMFHAMKDKSELVYLTTKERMGLMPAKLMEIIDKLNAFELTSSSQGCVDVLPRGCDKAKALERLCALLGIARENVMAIGDGENDIPMLRYAGVGVAMGQADDAVKRAADIVTVDHRDAGMAKAVYEVAMGYVFD
jgi:Cof subfamily protein (haloacid dehalogenase superfamily)